MQVLALRVLRILRSSSGRKMSAATGLKVPQRRRTKRSSRAVNRNSAILSRVRIETSLTNAISRPRIDSSPTGAINKPKIGKARIGATSSLRIRPTRSERALLPVRVLPDQRAVPR